MNNDPILSRVAVRKYTNQKVSKNDIDTLIAAFQAAPCGMHQADVMQLIVVTNDDIKHTMEEETNDAFYNAPLLMVIIAKKDSIFKERDASVAAENIMIEASRLGLGSVYVMGAMSTINGSATLREKLEIPEDFEAITVVPVGYAAQVNTEDRNDRYKVIIK